nr:MAG TPA: hypothetical protein [Caudoviricetes sp.]
MYTRKLARLRFICKPFEKFFRKFFFLGWMP